MNLHNDKVYRFQAFVWVRSQICNQNVTKPRIQRSSRVWHTGSTSCGVVWRENAVVCTRNLRISTDMCLPMSCVRISGSRISPESTEDSQHVSLVVCAHCHCTRSSVSWKESRRIWDWSWSLWTSPTRQRSVVAVDFTTRISVVRKCFDARTRSVDTLRSEMGLQLVRFCCCSFLWTQIKDISWAAMVFLMLRRVLCRILVVVRVAEISPLVFESMMMMMMNRKRWIPKRISPNKGLYRGVVLLNAVKV